MISPLGDNKAERIKLEPLGPDLRSLFRGECRAVLVDLRSVIPNPELCGVAERSVRALSGSNGCHGHWISWPVVHEVFQVVRFATYLRKTPGNLRKHVENTIQKCL